MKTKRDAIPRCQNCGGGPVNGGVCQACGHDANPYPSADLTTCSSCGGWAYPGEPCEICGHMVATEKGAMLFNGCPFIRHRYWNEKEDVKSGVSFWMYSHYGKNYDTWRGCLEKLTRAFSIPIYLGSEFNQGRGFRVDSNDTADMLEPDLITETSNTKETKTILDFIDDLPEPKRTALHMWMEDESHRTIAAKFEWNEEKSRIVIHRALTDLRNKFTLYCNENSHMGRLNLCGQTSPHSA